MCQTREALPQAQYQVRLPLRHVRLHLHDLLLIALRILSILHLLSQHVKFFLALLQLCHLLLLLSFVEVGEHLPLRSGQIKELQMVESVRVR